MQERPYARWSANGHHVSCREREHRTVSREGHYAARTTSLGEASVSIESGTGTATLEFAHDREPVVVSEITLAATGRGTKLKAGIEEQVMAYKERTRI